MKSKLVSLEDAASLIPSGSSLTIGGSIIRRSPVALIRELLHQKKSGFTVLAYPAGFTTDLLAGAGAVDRVEAVYEGLFQFGFSYNFRRGVEEGRIDIRDFSEVAMASRFRAAAAGLPFAVTDALLGTGMAEHNPEQVREIADPFSGRKLHALPAAESDFTLLHGYTADEYGNVQFPVARDADDLDPVMAKAANRLIVTVEKIVPHSEILKTPNLTYIPHTWVEAIVEVPFGAHPLSCDGYYDEDELHMEDYQRRMKEGDFASYADLYIAKPQNHAEYLAAALTPERLLQLSVR
ncbi:CoA transferase subunit A [Subtercola lobariae]|uniref:CoA transferase subunit A n=1 Tax=Subtercola lobariae TaxID=1588641 RepID=A0A917B312_9MICO|nr:CoA transferase subunit A [Subtercola lobariae]GGF18307.1 CoA transferase subunit A [Subtercola lobariae]